MSDEAPEWVIRNAVPEDENGVVYMWLKSYAHSTYGIKRNAHIDRSAAELAYWKQHAPIVTDLVRHEEVIVVCDPERSTHEPGSPAVIWGWACVSGDVVHYVCVKRSVVQAGIAPELIRALLGDRLQRTCFYTFELAELRRGQSGVSLPEQWRRADALWIPRRQQTWKRDAA